MREIGAEVAVEAEELEADSKKRHYCEVKAHLGEIEAPGVHCWFCVSERVSCVLRLD